MATAAHCLFDAAGRLESASTAVFGEKRDDPAREVPVSTCFLVEPQDGDFAVCVLSESVPNIPTIPVMSPCESEWLKPGGTAIEVGFGDTSLVPRDDSGTKSWLEVYLVRARSDEPYLEVSTGDQTGEYYGDSGGPLYFKMPDDTWRLVGTDSGSADILAGSTAPRFSLYANAPYFVTWAENATGLDLTPCHDGGRWRPKQGCSALPSSNFSVAESWESDCGTQAAARPRPTCQVGAGGEGSDVGDVGDVPGSGGVEMAPGPMFDDSPAGGSRLEGGACSQAPTSHGTLPSLVAIALLTAGGRRRHRRG